MKKVLRYSVEETTTALNQRIIGEAWYFKCDGWKDLSGEVTFKSHSQGRERANCTEWEEVYSIWVEGTIWIVTLKGIELDTFEGLQSRVTGAC